MINNPNMIHSPTYDLYVDSSTMLIYKRINRHRKSEITDDELVPAKLSLRYNGYIICTGAYANGNRCTVGIWRIFADCFPEQVHCWENHQADPENFCEIDHINGHETYASNFPSNLRWTTPRLNRARTSKTKDIFAEGVTEAERKKILRQRKYYHDKKQDPEWLARKRKADADRKKAKYEETKDLRRKQSAELNEQIRQIAESK